MDVNKISIAKVTTGLELSKPFVRTAAEKSYLEFECKNNLKKDVYDLTAQLRFYDKTGVFLGTDSDEHNAYLKTKESWAMQILYEPPENTVDIKLHVSAVAKEGFLDMNREILGIVFACLLGLGFYRVGMEYLFWRACVNQ